MARKRKPEPEEDAGSDPLGKSFAQYGSGLKVLLFLSAGLLFALCSGVLMGASERLASRLMGSDDDRLYRYLAWAIVGLAMLVAARGALYWGRSFEVRRQGVRFRWRRNVVEMRWYEIELIEVNRTHVLRNGVRTRTLYEIRIHSRDRTTIHLSSLFLSMVPSVPGLIGLLKMHSGQEIHLPVDF